jgi:phosphoglycolate phosphatase-like HAD superfamily hydrolase
MRFDAVVFDFDGTLVNSAGVKYDSFFKLFPATAHHRAVVKEVLATDPDGSRHAVIPRMVAKLRERGLPVPAGDSVETYGKLVEAAVSAAPEFPGATALLSRLKDGMDVYVASNTPQEAVRREAEQRGWNGWLKGVHGYPERKAEVVRAILNRDGIKPDRLAVVGDGISDEEAARVNHCVFIKITEPTDLARAGRQLELGDV